MQQIHQKSGYSKVCLFLLHIAFTYSFSKLLSISIIIHDCGKSHICIRLFFLYNISTVCNALSASVTWLHLTRYIQVNVATSRSPRGWKLVVRMIIYSAVNLTNDTVCITCSWYMVVVPMVIAS